MKIAVYLADQNPHRDRTLGVTNFTDCLLSGLSQRQDVQLTTVVSRSSYVFSGERTSSVCLPWPTDTSVLRLLTDNLGPILTPSLKPALFYYPKGYLSFLMRPRCLTVGTVHDTIIQHYADHYPGHRSAIDRAYWLGLMKASLKRFDLVLTVSDTAEKQIRDFCSRYRITPPPIRVTYEASHYEDVIVPAGCAKNYAVHFASEAPHKNSYRLLDLWRGLSQKKDLPELVVVGRRTPVVEKFLECPGVSYRACSGHSDITKVLLGARVLILPSEIEGFGLPALEGYYHGAAVCFVRGTSVDELISPFTSKGGFLLGDQDSFEAALDEALSMSGEDVRAVGSGLKDRFSKKNFVEAVARSFADALGGTA